MLSSKNRNTHPILLVPGMSGSILVKKGHAFKSVLGQRVVHNRWLMVPPLSNLKQWKEDMAYQVRRDRTSGRILGFSREDRDIVPYDVGGVNGIRDLVPELSLLPSAHQARMHSYFHHKYMGALVDDLVGRGAVVRETLFGLPYDFRLFLDPCERLQLFSQMKSWIEHAFERSGRAPVVVVTHSLGGILFKWFVSSCVSRNWLEEHVHEWICVNAPFGGTPYAVKAALCGENYLPFGPSQVEEVQRCSGVVMCMPNAMGAWTTADAFFTLPGESIGLGDYAAWASRGHVSFELWRDLVAPHLDLIAKPMPHLKTMVIGSHSVDTPRHFTAKRVHSFPHKVVYDPEGDGIVPHRGLALDHPMFEAAERLDWAAGVGHTAILDDANLGRIVWKAAGGSA